MNKFQITNIPDTNEDQPVLFRLLIGNNGKYYLHKGKKLQESAERVLDDVFRGLRGKKCPEEYSEVIKYCQKFPAIHKIGIEVVFNGDPEKLLKKEDALYKAMKNDDLSLNRLDLPPYKPEWMLKQALQKRCENCLKSGIVDGKKITFKFCPNCGRLNK